MAVKARKQYRKGIGIVAAATFVSCSTFGLSHAETSSEAKPQNAMAARYIVTYSSDGVSDDQRLPNLVFDGISREPLVLEKNEHAVELLTVESGVDTDEVISMLSAQSNVLSIEPDYIRSPSATPNDSLFHNQWYAQNTGANYRGRNGISGADVNLTGAWDIVSEGEEVVVAVIDNGTDINHPDLVNTLWQNPGEIAGNGIDDDRNGFVDDVHGWDFTGNDPHVSPDTTGRNHGTAVAGVIGAQDNNASGISGASWNVRIMTLKTDFSVSATIRAMDYARANGAHIINTSFGGSEYSQSEYNAIERLRQANVLMVASAGNEHWNNDFGPSYPGSYDSANILAVAATNPSDNFTTWSQYGQISVDIAAPGDAIYTTEANGTSDSTRYGWRNGTSFSSPLVAGIAALVKNYYPTAGYSELKGRILSSTDPISNGSCSVGSGGRANAGAALELGNQPVPSLTAIRWVDGNNQRVDDNEQGTLQLEFETFWESGGETTVILRSGDSLLNVSQPQQTIASMPVNSRFTVNFDADSGDLTGHHNLPINVQFVAPGFVATRDYCLQAGVLKHAEEVTETIQTNGQDDIHRYTIDITSSSSKLDLQLAASNNLDLYLRYGDWPQRDENLRTSSSYGSGAQTYMSTSVDGNESLLISSPRTGTWYVTVVNTSQRSNSSYTLQASTSNTTSNNGSNTPTTPEPETEEPTSEKPTTQSSGGGGGGSGFSLLGLLLITATRSIKQRVTSFK